jgi:hypothetical protein
MSPSELEFAHRARAGKQSPTEMSGEDASNAGQR